MGNVLESGKAFQRHRALAIILLRTLPRARDSDSRFSIVALQPPRPEFDLLAVRLQVGHFGWDSFGSRVEGERKAEQRNLQIAFARRVAFGDHRASAKRRNKRPQRGLNLQDDFRATLREKWRVARELERIAEALLMPDQDPLPLEGNALLPGTYRRMATCPRVRALPAKLVLFPSLGELPQDQPGQRFVPVGVRVSRVEAAHLVIGC